MFATFNSSMSGGESLKSTPPAAKRTRRSQVSRACDWCRLDRIKCDAQVPCKSCESRSRECSNGRDGLVAKKTLSLANKEIESLRAKISELETQIKDKPEVPSPTTEPHASSSSSSSSSPSSQQMRLIMPGASPAISSIGQLSGPSAGASNGHTHRMWDHRRDQSYEFDFISPTPSSLTALYSDLNTVARTQTYLTGVLQLSPSTESLDFSLQRSKFKQCSVPEQPLSRVQENQLLDLFWQSYYFIAPILNIQEFQEHHDLLWTYQASADFSAPVRKQSALVDIVLAVCMQSYSVQVAEYNLHVDDVATSGLWLYHRCQSALATESHGNTVTMLRCRIYCIIYLLNSGQIGLAYQALTSAAKLAQAMAINRKPTSSVSQLHQHVLRRIWWNLVMLDTRICLQLDRPYLLDVDEDTVVPPLDDTAEAELSGSSVFVGIPGWNHLNCNTHCIHLALLTRTTQSALRMKTLTLPTTQSGMLIHSHPPSLEACASYFLPRVKGFKSWVRSIPDILQYPRQGMAEPFSTSKSPLELDVYTPLCLQRQRIYLELSYHNTMASIYRPFIRFSLSSNSGTKDHSTPISDGHGVLALKHAAATTNIIFQLLNETEIINNWIHAYQFQWDAIVTLLTFAAAHPVCVFTTLTREAIPTAISNLEAFGKYGIAAAQSASRSARKIHKQVDRLAQMFSSQRSTSLSYGSSRQSLASSSIGTPSLDMRASDRAQHSLDGQSADAVLPLQLPHDSHNSSKSGSPHPMVLASSSHPYSTIAFDEFSEFAPTTDFFTFPDADCANNPHALLLRDGVLDDMHWTH